MVNKEGIKLGSSRVYQRSFSCLNDVADVYALEVSDEL